MMYKTVFGKRMWLCRSN